MDISREVRDTKTALERELLTIVDELVPLFLVMSCTPMVIEIVEKLGLAEG